MLRKYKRSHDVPPAVPGKPAGLRWRAFAPAAQSLPTDSADEPTPSYILIGGVAVPFVLDNSAISQFGLNGPIPAPFVGSVPRPAMPRVLACGVAALRRLTRVARTAANE